jgi:hypothetical protein
MYRSTTTTNGGTMHTIYLKNSLALAGGSDGIPACFLPVEAANAEPHPSHSINCTKIEALLAIVL